MDKGIICIQNFGTSGSLFLQTLLDGHPELFVMPALYTREIFQFWKKIDKSYSNEKITEEFVADPCQAYWFDASEKYKVVKDHNLNRMGKNAEENLVIDIKKFSENMINQLCREKISRKHFFLSVHEAFAITANLEFSKKKYIVFPFHTNPIKTAEFLIEDFQDVKFITTIREPIRNINSGQIYSMSTYGRTAGWFKWIWEDDQTCCILNKPRNESIGIKLEDIHDTPEKTLRKICKYLNIEWDDCLLESTILKKKWWNRSSSKKLSGFDKNLHKKTPIYMFNNFDKLRLEFLFYSWKKKWKYRNPKLIDNELIYFIFHYILIWIPFKFEFYPTHAFGQTKGKYILSITSPFINYNDFRENISSKCVYKYIYNIFPFGIKFLFSLKLFISGIKNFFKAYLKNRQIYIRYLYIQKNNKNLYKRYLDIL